MTYPPDPHQGQQSGSDTGGYGYYPVGGQDYPPVGPGYGYPPMGQYGAQYPYPPPPGTNGLAIAALITAVAGLSLCGFPSVLGLIFGIVSLQQIKKSGEQGRGMAIAGIVVGGIAAAVILAWLGIIIVASASS
ncbi:DUF4190 domain-containing protein [Tomitella biformata]|uniref:DUF4190 domain-containing protein n=1 Tax=Tomitella biformata TaxID=630403 RepID=UPI00046661B0|nr:DUF4190 domain-containing protein [Tomitella biformata]